MVRPFSASIVKRTSGVGRWTDRPSEGLVRRVGPRSEYACLANADTELR